MVHLLGASMKLYTPSFSLSIPDTKTLSINSKFAFAENQTCLGCVSAQLSSTLPLLVSKPYPVLCFTSSPLSPLNLNSHVDGQNSQRLKIRRRRVVAEAGDRDPSNQNNSVSETEREQNLRKVETTGVNFENNGVVSRDALWGGDSQAFRRVVVAGLLGTSVILGGNLAGITSLLLGLDPSFSRGTRADLIFPVKGFKRCLESNEGFEFIYPARWVGDQRLLYRAVERAERERSLELPSLRGELGRSQRKAVVEPLVAYGPPGSNGELNVSVIVAPVAPGFSLEMLGDPKEAAERILAKIIAPPGSDKVAVLLDASQRKEDNVSYYTIEFVVKGPSFFRHNVSVYAAYQDLLYTLNAQTPESSWDNVRDAFMIMADSFKVTGSPGSGKVDMNPRFL